jgi:2'-5' RNA ligase
MRLFVGCNVGPAVADAAAALIGELEARAARLAPSARLTWVPRERLHVTVRFIGHVDAARAAEIQRVLAPPLRQSAFDAVAEGVGVFPDRRPPRVVWAGLAAGRTELAALAREVNARLDPLVGGEQEELRPHLTLGRVKEPHGLRADALLAGLEHVALGRFRVDAITLYESRQSGGSLQYVPLMKTALEAE